jgi:hypothetical protein
MRTFSFALPAFLPFELYHCVCVYCLICKHLAPYRHIRCVRCSEVLDTKYVVNGGAVMHSQCVDFTGGAAAGSAAGQRGHVMDVYDDKPEML